MERKQIIRTYLKSGLNCAQVVAVTFSDKVNKDEKTILAAASGFGGGIGRQAMTCGALTGAVLALGFSKGQTEITDSVAKELTYQSVRDFFTRFTEIHGTVSCKDLLGSDISTPEGFELHKNGCNIDKCIGFIETSIDILDKMIF